MKSCAVCLARLLAAAWVGAAALFVIVSVLEVTSSDFTSEVKDQLAVLRFPAYYAAGSVLMAAALVGAAAGAGHPQLPRRRGWMVTGFLGAALALMAADYILIYKPLESLITPAGKPRTSEFAVLHKWSTRINGIQVGLCAVAAGLLCAPGRRTPEVCG